MPISHNKYYNNKILSAWCQLKVENINLPYLVQQDPMSIKNWKKMLCIVFILLYINNLKLTTKRKKNSLKFCGF